jgi:anti-sigma B factor antagonist
MALSSDPLVPRQQPTPGSALLVSTDYGNGQVIVELSGELDILGAALVTAALAAAVVRGPQVVVDVAGLDFIDCSGVTALARGRKLARDAGGELRLAALRPQVRRLLTLTRLTDVIPVHASAAEAAAMAGPGAQAAAPPAPAPVHAALT